MESFQKFILFGHPRSGSSNLTHILGEHNDIYCGGEIFNKHSKRMQDYLERDLGMASCLEMHPTKMQKEFYIRAQRKEQKKTIGFKIFKNHIKTMLQKQWALDPEHSVILLWRKNMLASAISFAIAHHTQRYNLQPGETLTVESPFSIPVERVEQWICAHRQWIAHLRTLLQGARKPFFECTYEDINLQTIQSMCAFLGHAPPESYSDYFIKMTKTEHYLQISNLQEIRNALENEENGFLNM